MTGPAESDVASAEDLVGDVLLLHVDYVRQTPVGPIAACTCGEWSEPFEAIASGNWARHRSEAVLAALGARVLPAGGVEREEWRATIIQADGRVVHGDTLYFREAAELELKLWSVGLQRATIMIQSRTVTEWPDGSMLVGAWKAVGDE